LAEEYTQPVFKSIVSSVEKNGLNPYSFPDLQVRVYVCIPAFIVF